MNNRMAIGAIIIGFTIVPLLVSAQAVQTVTDKSIQAQAQTLLNQVTALQNKLATSGGSGSTSTAASSSGCPNIGRSLRLGSSGDDVTRLQQYLAQDSTVYPEGTVSGYFGSLTQTAVERWQVKYNIVSSGSPSTTGYGMVGPRTAAAIALLCSTKGSGSATIGGFIQVTPITGAAPLNVSITANVNTVLSCAGATYSLDFGDGSPVQQIPVPQGNCQKLVQTFTHTYQYGGNYIIKLYSGTHQTTATITISGPAQPNNGGVPVANGTPISSVFDTFVPSVTAGTMPLPVTFAGIANSTDVAGCIANCGDIIDFGDGSTALVPLSGTATSIQSYSVTHTYLKAGTYYAYLYRGPSTSGTRTSNAVISVASNQIITSGLPAETFTISTSTGSAPLSILFSGVVSSNDQGYCNTGCKDTIDFGDGAYGYVALPTSVGNWINYSVLHTYSTPGGFTAIMYQGPKGTNQPTVGTASIAVLPGSAAGYTPMTVTPGVGGNPLAVTVTFNQASSCDPYQVVWGDSSIPDVYTPPSTTVNCVLASQTMTITHAYAASGSYSITLSRGTGTVNVNTATVTITTASAAGTVTAPAVTTNPCSYYGSAAQSSSLGYNCYIPIGISGIGA